MLVYFLCTRPSQQANLLLQNMLESEWKKRSERRKHCMLAVVRRSQKFSPRRRPFLWVDGQNLISWRWSLPLPTNPVWWRLMHAILSYRGNRPTNTHTNRQTGPITLHCAANLSTLSNEWIFICSAKKTSIILQVTQWAGQQGSKNDTNSCLDNTNTIYTVCF